MCGHQKAWLWPPGLAEALDGRPWAGGLAQLPRQVGPQLEVAALLPAPGGAAAAWRTKQGLA